MRHALGVIFFLVLGSAQAALVDRGEGFIYDDVLDITWTQNANINGLDTWENQMAWADSYTQTHSVYGTFADWRLASMDVNGDGTVVDCSIVQWEPTCRDNEYGYMYRENGISYSSPGLFTNVENYYWSLTETNNPDSAMEFGFNRGNITGNDKTFVDYAWAVMDGDIAASVVPIPAAVWLFGSALAGLGWMRRKKTA